MISKWNLEKLKKTSEEIAQVGTISANGEKEIGDMIAKEVNVYELQEEREMKTLSKFQKEHDGYEYELEYKKR